MCPTMGNTVTESRCVWSRARYCPGSMWESPGQIVSISSAVEHRRYIVCDKCRVTPSVPPRYNLQENPHSLVQICLVDFPADCLWIDPYEQRSDIPLIVKSIQSHITLHFRARSPHVLGFSMRADRTFVPNGYTENVQRMQLAVPGWCGWLLALCWHFIRPD